MSPYEKQQQGFRDEERMVRFAFIVSLAIAVVFLGALYQDLAPFLWPSSNP